MALRSLFVGLLVGLFTACGAPQTTAVVQDERVMVLPADVVLPAVVPTPTVTPLPPTVARAAPTTEPTPLPAPTAGSCLDRSVGASGRPDCVVPILVAGPAITQARFFDAPDGEPVNIIFDFLDETTTGYDIVNPTQFDNPLSLAVVAGSPGDVWAQVQVPTRPVVRVWVQTQGFMWQESDGYMRVDLATSQLWAWAGEELFVDGVFVQTGHEDSSTPLGTTYIDEVITGDAVPAAYGSAILSMATFSEVLPRFGNGLPKLSINGTNFDALPTGPLSQGSIKTDNDLIDLLVSRLGPGARIDVIDSSDSDE